MNERRLSSLGCREGCFNCYSGAWGSAADLEDNGDGYTCPVIPQLNAVQVGKIS